MSEHGGKKTFLAAPGYGRQTFGAGRALWRARRDMDPVYVAIENGSLLAANFNKLWCTALNLVHHGGRVDYFAMLHDDITADDFWLDELIDEMEAQDLDALGVVVPIKDTRGLTSLALHEPGDNWQIAARLSMHEVFSLPETFTSEDVGRPLLLNTGMWVCRFDMEWARQVHFEINDRIVFSQAENCYKPQNESEDWYFSRLLHEQGLKIGATRKIAVEHTGEMRFHNRNDWGSQQFDSDCTTGSLLPRVDRDGFAWPQDVRGWLRRPEGKALWRLAEGKRVLEIGAYCGLSTICLAQNAASVLSIDPHDGRGTPEPGDTFAEFERNLEHHGVTDKVTPFIGPLEEYAGEDRFDLIFVDGCHDLDSVRSDADRALSLLADGGLLAFHDYHEPSHPAVATVVDELVSAGGDLIFTEHTLAVVRPPARIALET